MWKINDKAVCVKKGEWRTHFGAATVKAPAFDEVVCVRQVNVGKKNSSEIFLNLTGFVGRYNSIQFRKIHDAETGNVEKLAKKILGFMPPPHVNCKLKL